MITTPIASSRGVAASRKSTSVRGTITSRSSRSPAENTSSMSSRSSGDRSSWEATIPRSSSPVICSLPACGIAAQQADDAVGRRRQQPDERARQRGEDVHRRGQQQRHRLGPLQRQPLGDQLAEHQRHVGDRDGDPHEGDGARGSGRQTHPLEHRLDAWGDLGGTETGGDEAGQGDADLHGGQEPVGGRRQRRQPAAARPRLRQPLDLAVPQGHQRDLGGGEEAADEDEARTSPRLTTTSLTTSPVPVGWHRQGPQGGIGGRACRQDRRAGPGRPGERRGWGTRAAPGRAIPAAGPRRHPGYGPRGPSRGHPRRWTGVDARQETGDAGTSRGTAPAGDQPFVAPRVAR